MIETVRSMTAADRAANRNWFSQETNGAGVATHALVDMHEHLRQSRGRPVARPTLLMVLALVLCSSTEAEGQIWERFSFQESFTGKPTAKPVKARPASFSVLLPGDTTASYSIRTSMRVNLGSGGLDRRIDVGPYVEYRLLTNIKKPQNVLIAGLATDWATRDGAESQRWSAVLAASINFKNDFERATKSWQMNLLFTPVASDQGGGLGNLLRPNVPTQFGSAVEFTYSPSIGFEHEDVLRAADQHLDRTVIRAVSGVRAELLPLPSRLARRLELNFEYSYVYDLRESAASDGPNRGHQLVTADANVWFVRTEAGSLAGMSLKYTNGENPRKGFRQQKLMELTFSVKF